MDVRGRCGNTTTIWYCLKKSKGSGSTVSRWDSLQCSLIYLEMYSYLFHLDFSFRWEAGKEAFSVQHFTVWTEPLCGSVPVYHKVGSFDVDDLLLNTIGGICGYILFVICAAIRRRHAGKKTKKQKMTESKRQRKHARKSVKK